MLEEPGKVESMIPLRRCRCGAEAEISKVEYDAADYGEDGFYYEVKCKERCGLWACGGDEESTIKLWNEIVEKDEMPDVLMFIRRFSTDGHKARKDVLRCFLEGCCYWFAFILERRFCREYATDIVVDYIVGHFGCRINGHVYDITGDVTNQYKWEKWDDCDDSALKERITEQCIMF